jgi:alpha-mannosidase
MANFTSNIIYIYLQAYNKRANRKAEVLYHNAEWLNALANVLLPDFSYPAHSLNEGWELILLNQFHDILPGSSVHDVYVDSRADYEQINDIGVRAFEGAAFALAEAIVVTRDSLVVLNPLPSQCADLVELYPFETLIGKSITGRA